MRGRNEACRDARGTQGAVAQSVFSRRHRRPRGPEQTTHRPASPTCWATLARLDLAISAQHSTLTAVDTRRNRRRRAPRGCYATATVVLKVPPLYLYHSCTADYCTLRFDSGPCLLDFSLAYITRDSAPRTAPLLPRLHSPSQTFTYIPMRLQCVLSSSSSCRVCTFAQKTPQPHCPHVLLLRLVRRRAPLSPT